LYDHAQVHDRQLEGHWADEKEEDAWVGVWQWKPDEHSASSGKSGKGSKGSGKGGKGSGSHSGSADGWAEPEPEPEPAPEWGHAEASGPSGKLLYSYVEYIPEEFLVSVNN